MKSDEAVVSDLITALLSVSIIERWLRKVLKCSDLLQKIPQPTFSASSRRSSNDSSVFRPSRGGFIKVSVLNAPNPRSKWLSFLLDLDILKALNYSHTKIILLLFPSFLAVSIEDLEEKFWKILNFHLFL